jgi:RNA-directed DNA polymerase
VHNLVFLGVLHGLSFLPSSVMNEFDQFMKHTLRAKHYLRYADDFVFLSGNREWLEIILLEIRNFLLNRL